MIPQYDEPDEIAGDFNAEQVAKQEADRAADYERLCTALKTMRDAAVKGRAESGIEDIWTEDQEHYDGIDDANRPEKASKPSSMSGSVTFGGREDKTKQNRSTVFVEITRPYVDAASARVADMLLPTDDRNWSIVPTPIPDLIEQLKDQTPLMNGGIPVMAQTEGGQQVQATAADQANAVMDAAKKACEKAQIRIDDWLTEAMYLDECRSVIDDSARIGVGILKGPVPKRSRKKAVIQALEGIGIIIKEEIAPNSCRVDPWNFYPDPGCGEDIQRGKYAFEKDDITGRILSDLKGLPGYLDDVIDQILEEGPEGHKEESQNRREIRNRSDAELFRIWYFHGYLSANDLDLLGEEHGSGEQFPVICTIVNDKIIKAALSTLDSGEFPYDVFAWQRRPGHWAGKGVSRQMRVEQRGVNAATRALMDNMGESARPHRVINRNAMTQGPDRWTWYAKDGEDVPDVSRAMFFFAAPSMQTEIMNVIQFWSKKAEDATGLPMLLQGQLGSAPDTVGGMQMLANNASAVLRRIAKNYDARITERHIGRYYEWLLIHGKDDSEKGDFTVKARGSSALVERDSQSQLLIQLLAVSQNPIYKLSPEKIAAKILKSQRFDVEDVQMDEAEIQQMQQAQQGQQQDPRMAVAQMNAQVKQASEQAETERLNMRLQAENQKLMVELQARQQAEELDRTLTQWEKQIDAQIEAARINAESGMNVEALKAELAQTTMKLRTQMQLAGKAQVLTPPVEPLGRAPNGQAFTQ